MRVLHVITGLRVGGAETMLVRLVERLQAAGHCNFVLSLSQDRALEPRLADAGVAVATLGLGCNLTAPAALLPMRNLVRQHRPEIVHGWMYHGNLGASLARLLASRRPPVVWGVRASVADLCDFKPQTRTVIRANAWLSRTTSAVVYCARTIVAEHERLGFCRDRGVVIPNGIDCERFCPSSVARNRLRRELGLSAECNVVGLLARWDRQKDHASLLTATARLIGSGRSLHLVLAGSEIGPGNVDLREAIAANALDRHVTLLGERHDTDQLVAALDLFVLPSAFGEACPNALVEAMAAGVPCVATDVGDCAWIVGNTGIIVPPRDPEALAAAMARILSLEGDARLELGSRARARVQANFSLPEIVQRYESLYRKVAECAA